MPRGQTGSDKFILHYRTPSPEQCRIYWLTLTGTEGLDQCSSGHWPMPRAIMQPPPRPWGYSAPTSSGCSKPCASTESIWIHPRIRTDTLVSFLDDLRLGPLPEFSCKIRSFLSLLVTLLELARRV